MSVAWTSRSRSDVVHLRVCPLSFTATPVMQELVEAVVLPMTQAERFKAVGIQPPKVRSCRV